MIMKVQSSTMSVFLTICLMYNIITIGALPTPTNANVDAGVPPCAGNLDLTGTQFTSERNCTNVLVHGNVILDLNSNVTEWMETCAMSCVDTMECTENIKNKWIMHCADANHVENTNISTSNSFCQSYASCYPEIVKELKEIMKERKEFNRVHDTMSDLEDLETEELSQVNQTQMLLK
eukprot:Awhi_evm1s6636